MGEQSNEGKGTIYLGDAPHYKGLSDLVDGEVVRYCTDDGEAGLATWDAASRTLTRLKDVAEDV